MGEPDKMWQCPEEIEAEMVFLQTHNRNKAHLEQSQGTQGMSMITSGMFVWQVHCLSDMGKWGQV